MSYRSSGSQVRHPVRPLLLHPLRSAAEALRPGNQQPAPAPGKPQ